MKFEKFNCCAEVNDENRWETFNTGEAYTSACLVHFTDKAENSQDMHSVPLIYDCDWEFVKGYSFEYNGKELVAIVSDEPHEHFTMQVHDRLHGNMVAHILIVGTEVYKRIFGHYLTLNWARPVDRVEFAFKALVNIENL